MDNGRVRIAAWILAAVLLGSTGGTWYVCGRCRALLRETEALLSLAEMPETDAGRLAEQTQSLTDHWQRDCFWLRFVVPDQPLQELNRSVSRLPAALDDPAALAGELYAIRADLLWLRQSELPF